MNDRFLVLGRGRLGNSLHTALLAAGLRSQLLPGRHGVGTLRQRLGENPGAYVILAVPDPAVQSVASVLATSGVRPGTTVIHLSGSLGLGPLDPLRTAGCAVGAFHPLQSFPEPRPPEAFRGSLFGIDASSEALLAELDDLATALGGLSRRVRDEQRALYHLAASMVSSYMACLADQGATALRAAGWSRAEALEALIPLMTGAVDNLAAHGLPGALIGPIRRGDPDTVQRHLAAIATASHGGHLDAVYRTLGMVAVDLAAEAGLDAGRVTELAKLLRPAVSIAG